MINQAVVSFILTIMYLLMMPAGSYGGEDGQADAMAASLPAATYLGGEKTISEVTAALEAAGLSNTDMFRAWTTDFAATAGKSAALADIWQSPDSLTADTSKTMDGWEAHHDYSDADCRMTAFLLLDGLLSAEKLEEEYTGTYLMFDLEAMDQADRYESLRKNRALFTTLFGDKTVEEGKEPQTVFSEVWKKYGMKIKQDNVSILSVVVYDPSFRTTFVGHTGVLVNQGESLLFVEKIAFEQPYQATKVRTLDELLAVLSQRPEYFGGDGEPGPFVYVNGEYVATLKYQGKLDDTVQQADQ